jgi:serine/threonine protein phosphatase PrpC
MSQNITQQIQVVQRSEIGLKRSVNQDSIGVRVPQVGQASQHALFVVADGVGGNLPKGEVASHTAVEAVFAYYYAESDETDMLTRVGDALQDTNIAVRDQAAAEGVPAIGTTIVGLAIAPSGEAIGFNVGDSRLYRIRGGEIELISEDQVSLPEPGVLKDEFKSRRITKISSYLGQPHLLEPNFYRLKTQPGDTFVLCSDGVWSKIPDEELLQNIDRQPLEQASERLVKLVYERNAPDNLSVILVRLDETDTRKTLAEPIGEMPTAITAKPTATASSEGGRSMTPLIIGGVVLLAVIIGAVALLQNRSDSVSVTPTVGTIVVANSTEEPAKTVPAASATKSEATHTPVSATTAAAVASKASDTPKPSATSTPLPKPATNTALPSLTATHTATATDTPSPTPKPSSTHVPTNTSAPTIEPTVVAQVVPSDTATITASPTVKPSATHTASPSPEPTLVPSDTPQPSETPTPITPTTTINPTLITYTPSATFTPTPSLTATLTFTPTATATDTNTPTATATFTDTPTNTPTLTYTPSPTLTPTVTLTPSLTPNAQQAAQTATAKASITPTIAPTPYAPRDNDVITLSQSVTFYPSTDSSSFTLPESGGVELPADTVVKVISSQSTPIDGLIYSYVSLQTKVDGVSSDTGWAALAPAAQAMVTAHIQNGVTIRKGPSQLYERIGIGLKDGERAVVLGQATLHGQRWYYVDPENPQSSSGWIWSGVKGLELQGNISNVPQRNFLPEPTLTPTPVPTETPTLSA